MRVAQNDLGTHVDELVDKEQAALKHLLVNQDAPPRLGRRHQDNGQQIRGEARPRRVGHSQQAAIDEGVDLVVVLGRDLQVLSPALHADAQTLEHVGDDAKLVVRAILDGDFTLCHRREADETPNLNHVGQAAVLRASQRRHTFDGQQIGSDPADFATHAVDHFAELLEVGLACRIVNRGGALGKGRRHDHVGRACHRRFVEQHVGALQSVWRARVEETCGGVVGEFCTELLEPNEVGVHAAAANLVSTWTWDGSQAKPAQHRPQDHDGTSQRTSLGSKRLGLEVVQVHVVRFETPRPRAEVLGFHPQIAQQVDQLVDVDNVWQVVDGHGLCSEHHCTQNLQRLVLRTLGNDLPVQPLAALNDETSHAPEFRGPTHAPRRATSGLSTPIRGKVGRLWARLSDASFSSCGDVPTRR